MTLAELYPEDEAQLTAMDTKGYDCACSDFKCIYTITINVLRLLKQRAVAVTWLCCYNTAATWHRAMHDELRLKSHPTINSIAATKNAPPTTAGTKRSDYSSDYEYYNGLK